jgi:membrane protein implicated in regulation of membrane protease activity
MAMRIIFNGKEVTNRFALLIVRVLAVAPLILILVLVLPLISITVALSLTILLAAVVAILLALLSGALLSRVRKPKQVALEESEDK